MGDRIEGRPAAAKEGTAENAQLRKRLWWLGGAALVVLLWFAWTLVLVVFASVLFAVFLYGVSAWVSRHTRSSYKISLLFVTLALTALVVGVGWLIAPRVVEECAKMMQQLPAAWGQLGTTLRQYPMTRPLAEMLPVYSELSSEVPALLKKSSGMLGTFIGGLAYLVVFLVLALYFASDHKNYIKGLVNMVPPSGRDRAREVLQALGGMLQRWIIGRFFLMLANGVITALFLAALGVPLAMTLGLIAGLLNFIPNFGPFIAAAPAVLLALVKDPQTAIYVAGFYFFYQMLDGYLLTPLVQKQTVSVSPALTIIAQVLLGLIWGTLGLLLADPLIAAVVALVKMLYLEDSLGDRVKIPGQK